MIRMSAFFLVLGVFAFAARAQEEPPRPAYQVGKPEPGAPVPDPKAAEKRIKKLGEDKYELGTIQFNARTREVRIPCMVNMTNGQVEYWLVHETGKTHESVLKTTVSALDLQVVLLLTNYQPGHTGLFEYEDPEARKRHEPTAPKTPGANRVSLEVEWMDNGKMKRMPATQWVLEAPKNQPTQAVPHWIFNGSMLQLSGFSAQIYGNLIALYYDATAIMNCPGKLNSMDDVWSPNEKIMPKVDTPVTVIITPYAPQS